MSSAEWAEGRSAPPPPPGPPPLMPEPNDSLAGLLWSGRRPWGRIVSRSALFVILGGVVTSFLSMFMYSLIKFRQVSVGEETGYKQANFIRLKEESSVNRRTRELPKKEVREKQPETPTLNVKMDQSRKLDVSALRIDVPDAPKFSGKLSLVGSPGVGKGTVIKDQEMMPFARVKPVYPPDAHERGIEGWVDLKFTVTKNGSVSNPRVVRAEPPSVFNRAAINAVKKWKYRPKKVDGQAVDVPNVSTRVTFDINDP